MTIHVTTDKTFQKDVIEASKKGTVMVDFWASWCAPCKKVEPIVESLSEELTDVKFTKMSIEENMTIPLELGIQSVPTFAIYKDGELVSTHVGGSSRLGFKKILGV